jgi:hypothetical protein
MYGENQLQYCLLFKISETRAHMKHTGTCAWGLEAESIGQKGIYIHPTHFHCNFTVHKSH